MYSSDAVFNHDIELWFDELLGLVREAFGSHRRPAVEEYLCEMKMLSFFWLDHYLNPDHCYVADDARSAVLAISDPVVLGYLGYEEFLWDKILELAMIIAEMETDSGDKTEALRFLSLVEKRLESSKRRSMMPKQRYGPADSMSSVPSGDDDQAA